MSWSTYGKMSSKQLLSNFIAGRPYFSKATNWGFCWLAGELCNYILELFYDEITCKDSDLRPQNILNPF
jgi:hypothetical protein